MRLNLIVRKPFLTDVADNVKLQSLENMVPVLQ